MKNFYFYSILLSLVISTGQSGFSSNPANQSSPHSEADMDRELGQYRTWERWDQKFSDAIWLGGFASVLAGGGVVSAPSFAKTTPCICFGVASICTAGVFGCQECWERWEKPKSIFDLSLEDEYPSIPVKLWGTIQIVKVVTRIETEDQQDRIVKNIVGVGKICPNLKMIVSYTEIPSDLQEKIREKLIERPLAFKVLSVKEE